MIGTIGALWLAGWLDTVQRWMDSQQLICIWFTCASAHTNFICLAYINNALLTECNYNSTDSNQWSGMVAVQEGTLNGSALFAKCIQKSVALNSDAMCFAIYIFSCMRCPSVQWTAEQRRKKTFVTLTNIESLSIMQFDYHMYCVRLTGLLLLARL